MGTRESDVSPSKASRPAPLVVLADDTAALRLLLRRVLEKAGYCVEACADGEQALEAYRTLKPDLIVTDDNMPKLKGTELLRRVRASGDPTPVLVVSSYFDDASRATCLEHPNVTALNKPFTISDFTQAVEALLRNPAKR